MLEKKDGSAGGFLGYAPTALQNLSLPEPTTLPQNVSKIYYILFEYVDNHYTDQPEVVRQLIFSTAYTIYCMKKKAALANGAGSSSRVPSKLYLDFYNSDTYRVLCSDATDLIEAAMSVYSSAFSDRAFKFLDENVTQAAKEALGDIAKVATTDINDTNTLISTLKSETVLLAAEISSLKDGVSEIKALTPAGQKASKNERSFKEATVEFLGEVFGGGIKEAARLLIFGLLLWALSYVLTLIFHLALYCWPDLQPFIYTVEEGLHLPEIQNTFSKLFSKS